MKKCLLKPEYIRYRICQSFASVCVCVRVRVCVCVCVCVRARVRASVCVCVHARAHALFMLSIICVGLKESVSS